MNATIERDDLPAAHSPARPAPHATSKFRLLLRREFWEHRGGFLWAPIVAGGISLLLTLMALVLGEIALRRHGGLPIDGNVRINGLDLGALSSTMSTGDMAQVAEAINGSVASAMLWPMLVLGFVVFFYCLGALFDERKDRSVLFWKSLPVSDRDTVLSKVVSALLVAPTIAMLVGVACMVAFLLLLSVFVLIHNGNPLALLWSPGNLVGNAGVALAAIPLYALWALPSVGWLLLCSVWARSKPFLWAIMIPVFTGVFVSWFGLMNLFQTGSGWFWKNIVAHLLGGVFPGTWLSVVDSQAMAGGKFPTHIAIVQSMYTALASPQLWIGAAAGVLMILAAIRLRRWRDDA